MYILLRSLRTNATTSSLALIYQSSGSDAATN